jgi:hypothetical protein
MVESIHWRKAGVVFDGRFDIWRPMPAQTIKINGARQHNPRIP